MIATRGLIAAILVLLLVSCAGGPYVRPGFDSYRREIHTVAVLPFDNLTRESEADVAHDLFREAVFTELQKTSADRGLEVILLSPSAVDRRLREAELQDHIRANERSYAELAQILSCDAVLEGAVTKYYKPSTFSRILSWLILVPAVPAAVALGSSRVAAEVKIRDCRDESLLWEYKLSGASFPTLVERNKMLQDLAKNVAKKWPL